MKTLALYSAAYRETMLKDSGRYERIARAAKIEKQ